jgi:uncharacterized protein YbjT (DUF2867 family)
MRIVIFGGTGRIGTALSRAALSRGHDVVAVARRPQAVAYQANGGGRLTVVAADVLEPGAVAAPVAGAGAVLFAVGLPGQGPTIVRSAGIRAVTGAMADAGVSRLVAVSPSAAFVSPCASMIRKIVRRNLTHKVWHNPFLDAYRMEDELRSSATEWSVLRGPRLLDGPGTGSYSLVPAHLARAEPPLPLADFAECVVACAEEGGNRDIMLVAPGTTAIAASPVKSAAAAGEE